MNQLLPLFAAQRRAFETAYMTGEWAGLGKFFADDITYEVVNMPFFCVLHGRDAVLSGFDRSVERFDKLCIRTVGLDSVVRQEGSNVLISSGIRFERGNAPVFSARLWEIASYVDEKIVRLMDVYDLDCNERFERWMDDWGEGLDPAYE